MTKAPVPRALRLVNVLALLLVLAGAGLHVWSWLGMRRLESYVAPPDAPAFSGMARFDHYWELSRLGTWLVLAGVGVAVLSAIAAVVVRRRRGASAGGPPEA